MEISTDHCVPEWSSFGTCCESEQIVDYIEEKLSLNRLALKAVVNEVSSLEAKLIKFEKTHRLQGTASVGNGVSFSTAGSPLLGFEGTPVKIKEMSQKIGKAIIDSLLQNVEFQQKCVAKINSVISKSACSICSGRSDDFFNKDGKLDLSEGLCRSVLEDCSEAWMSMVRMVVDVRGYTKLIRQLNPDGDKDGILEEKGFTMNLDSFITNRNLIPILDNCRGSSLANCSFEHVAALCEQFIHIQAPTYIESSQSQAQKMLTSLKAAHHKWSRTVPGLTKASQSLAEESSHLVSWRKASLDNGIINTGVRVQSRIAAARMIWVTIQLDLPVLQLIFEKPLQPLTKVQKALLKAAISQAQADLTQIENTIAAAALPLHKTFRHFILSTDSSVQKQRAEENCDLICSLVEKVLFETYTDTREQILFEDLNLRAANKFRSGTFPEEWLSANRLFLVALKDKVKELAEKITKKVRTAVKQNTQNPRPPIVKDLPLKNRPGRVLQTPIVADNRKLEVSVVTNQQCHPCVTLGENSDMFSRP